MTATAAQTQKDQELMSFGFVELASVNSFAEFVTSNLNVMEENEAKDKHDFIDIFICHLIFYAIFCISLVIHIFIDLGLRSLLKNKFIQLIKITKNIFVEKKPAFA